MILIEQNGEVITEHVPSAALAVALGHQILRIEGSPGGRRRFVFDASVAPVLRSYHRADTLVPAGRYFGALNTLRTLMKAAPATEVVR